MIITDEKRERQLAKLNYQKEKHQSQLNAISSSIDMSKLKYKKPLPVDQSGKVHITASHPDYKYWTEDDQ